MPHFFEFDQQMGGRLCRWCGILPAEITSAVCLGCPEEEPKQKKAKTTPSPGPSAGGPSPPPTTLPLGEFGQALDKYFKDLAATSSSSSHQTPKLTVPLPKPQKACSSADVKRAPANLSLEEKRAIALDKQRRRQARYKKKLHRMQKAAAAQEEQRQVLSFFWTIYH